MRRILSALALLALGGPVMAQGFKIGPELGATYNTMSQKLGGTTRETNYQVGFRVGVVSDIKFAEQFALQPGLFLSVNNGTESYYERYYRTAAGVPTSDHDRRNYQFTALQLPVYAMFKTGKEFDDHHFFFGIGPSFNYAISGNFKQEYTNTLNGKSLVKRYDYTLPIGYDKVNDKLRPFDISANVTIGYEMPAGLFFRAYYGLGLLNVAPGGDSDNCFRNSGGGLSIGFLFKTSRKAHWE
jgi:hypothetical protein